MRRGAGIRIVEPPDPRDRARKLYNPMIVDVIEHRGSADLPDSRQVYCLHLPKDYIGAGVVELKFRPGQA